ncbi:hypothetical protein scyTo_0000101 [Scyliorhinus torazame]|uniref:Uncharacterized protein n=1 Tax=Scyliorhinus torazame TaxID=75743 RepID=A0A401NQ17_SCYTO|nr:hypothetical protein [Scyliorhinus torazame]
MRVANRAVTAGQRMRSVRCRRTTRARYDPEVAPDRRMRSVRDFRRAHARYDPAVTTWKARARRSTRVKVEVSVFSVRNRALC